ncbi:MAG: carbohydrate ABC transporter permease [Oscillospiraceae bacterium]
MSKKIKRSRRFSLGIVITTLLKYLLLVAASFVVIAPLVVILFGSLKAHNEFSSSNVFSLPTKFIFENYKTAFIQGNVLEGLRNTGIIIAVSCFGTITTGTMTAFVMQRFSSIFTRLIKTLFLLAMLLPNISMQVTVFQIVSKLGLYNTMAAPMILYIGTDIISIYIFMQFLSQISVSLDESAIVDGASYPRIYFSIILPLLKPAIATVLIIKFVGIYNDFYTANLYMQNDDVVSTALYRFIGPFGAQWEIIFAGIIICIIPTLVVFLFLQKYIYTGLVSGSVKE